MAGPTVHLPRLSSPHVGVSSASGGSTTRAALELSFRAVAVGRRWRSPGRSSPFRPWFSRVRVRSGSIPIELSFFCCSSPSRVRVRNPLLRSELDLSHLLLSVSYPTRPRQLGVASFPHAVEATVRSSSHVTTVFFLRVMVAVLIPFHFSTPIYDLHTRITRLWYHC